MPTALGSRHRRRCRPARHDDAGPAGTPAPRARNGHLLKPGCGPYTVGIRGATPAYSHRWATTLAAARVPLEIVFKNLGYSLRGSDTSAEQARPDSAGAGPNPSCCQARPSWQVGLARLAPPGGEGGWRAPSLTHVVPRRAASGASPRSRRSEGSNSSQRRPRPVLQPPMNP